MEVRVFLFHPLKSIEESSRVDGRNDCDEIHGMDGDVGEVATNLNDLHSFKVEGRKQLFSEEHKVCRKLLEPFGCSVEDIDCDLFLVQERESHRLDTRTHHGGAFALLVRVILDEVVIAVKANASILALLAATVPQLNCCCTTLLVKVAALEIPHLSFSVARV